MDSCIAASEEMYAVSGNYSMVIVVTAFISNGYWCDA